MTGRVADQVALANVLWHAHHLLTRYRETAERLHRPRLALSDLATFDALVQIGEAQPDPEKWARDTMAALIEYREQPSLGDDSGGVYQAHQDEVRDALEALDLLPEEEPSDDGDTTLEEADAYLRSVGIDPERVRDKAARPDPCHPVHDACGTSDEITTCGTCLGVWCDRCDPAHGPLCPWCHGMGYSTAAIREPTYRQANHVLGNGGHPIQGAS